MVAAPHALAQRGTRDQLRHRSVRWRPVYEVRDDGERIAWGWVLEWEPPRRFVMAWHPGSTAEQAQEVELRFTPVPDGTKVDLEHRKWEKLGEGASAAREGYNAGWETVFVVTIRARLRFELVSEATEWTEDTERASKTETRSNGDSVGILGRYRPARPSAARRTSAGEHRVTPGQPRSSPLLRVSVFEARSVPPVPSVTLTVEND